MLSLMFITDKVPWRYIVPRKSYRRNIKLAKKIPKIAHLINRQAFFRASEFMFYVVLSPLILIGAVLMIIAWALTWVTANNRFPIIPDFNEIQGSIVEEAWRIVPLEEAQAIMEEDE